MAGERRLVRRRALQLLASWTDSCSTAWRASSTTPAAGCSARWCSASRRRQQVTSTGFFFQLEFNGVGQIGTNDAVRAAHAQRARLFGDQPARRRAARRRACSRSCRSSRCSDESAGCCFSSCCSLAAAGLRRSAASLVDRIVAVVNKEVITASELNEAVGARRAPAAPPAARRRPSASCSSARCSSA